MGGAPPPQEGKESHGTEGGAKGESGRHTAISRSCTAALDYLPSHMRVVEEAHGVAFPAVKMTMWKDGDFCGRLVMHISVGRSAGDSLVDV